MKKLNVILVVTDHIGTLRDDNTGERSYSDVATFYGIPAILCAVYYWTPIKLPDDLISSLIAVFAVFSALLFSAQIALYNLSIATTKSTGDAISDEREVKRMRNERTYFSDVNYNVSYLILVSCLSLITFIVLLIFPLKETVEGALLVLLTSHFFLSLLMLIKRSHIAFALKYRD